MLLSDRSRTPPPSNTSGIPTLPRFTPIPSIAAPVEPAMIRVAGAHFSCISSGRGLLKPLREIRPPDFRGLEELCQGHGCKNSWRGQLYPAATCDVFFRRLDRTGT